MQKEFVAATSYSKALVSRVFAEGGRLPVDVLKFHEELAKFAIGRGVKAAH